MFLNFPWPSYIDLKARGEIWGGDVTVATTGGIPLILDEAGFNIGQMLNVASDEAGNGRKLKIIYGGIYRCSISSSVNLSETSVPSYAQRLNVNGIGNTKLAFTAPIVWGTGSGADTKFMEFAPDDIVTCEIITPEAAVLNFANYGLIIEKVGSDNEIGN